MASQNQNLRFTRVLYHYKLGPRASYGESEGVILRPFVIFANVNASLEERCASPNSILRFLLRVVTSDIQHE